VFTVTNIQSILIEYLKFSLDYHLEYRLIFLFDFNGQSKMINEHSIARFKLPHIYKVMSNDKLFKQVCQEGNEVEVLKHLKLQTLQHRSIYGHHGMYQACLHGQIHIVDLLERELRIPYGNRIWLNGLIGACAAGNAILVKRMIDNGAENNSRYVNFKIEYIIKLLHRCKSETLKQVIKYTRDNEDMNIVALMFNIEPRVLKFIIQGACEIENLNIVKLMLSFKSGTLKWVMQGACESGNLSMVKLIFNSGIDDWKGVMYSAGKSGSMDVIEFLIDIGLADWKGGLAGGCHSGNMDIVTLMLKLGSMFSINHKVDGIEGSDLNYRLGLVNACRGGHLEIVKLMLEFDIRDYSCALQAICFNGNMEIIELILDRCAQHAKMGNSNFSEDIQAAFESACMRGQLDVIVYMIKRGAIVTDRRIKVSRDPEVIELLKAAKENPDCLTLVKPIRS
jgi:ankyrin repeat protein